MQSLEPDLIILDDFQRFHDLLHGKGKAADLARQLFTNTDTVGNSAKTLLLSATPFRMLTFAGDASVSDRDAGIAHRVRHGVDDPPWSGGNLPRMFARTERVAETADRDAMIHELHQEVDLRKDNLIEARAIPAPGPADQQFEDRTFGGQGVSDPEPASKLAFHALMSGSS